MTSLWDDTTEALDTERAQRDRQHAIASVNGLVPFVKAAASERGFRDRLATVDSAVLSGVLQATGNTDQVEAARDFLHEEWKRAHAARLLAEALAPKAATAPTNPSYTRAKALIEEHGPDKAYELYFDGTPGASFVDWFNATSDTGNVKASKTAASWVPAAEAVLEGKSFKSVTPDNEIVETKWKGDEVSPHNKGVVLDMTTAHMLLQIYNALTGERKQKFAEMPIMQAVDMGWKLVNRQKTSAHEAPTDHEAKPEWDTAQHSDLCDTCGWPVSKGKDGKWTHDAKNPVEWSDKRTAAAYTGEPHPEYPNMVWTDPKVEGLVLDVIEKADSPAAVAQGVMDALNSVGYDSMDREMAFWMASQMKGWDYNDIYDEWLKTGSRRTAAHPEPDPSITGGWSTDYWGSYQHGETGQIIYMYRKGQKVRFFGEDGQQVGPEQSNVAPAVAWAHSSGYHNPDLAGLGPIGGSKTAVEACPGSGNIVGGKDGDVSETACAYCGSKVQVEKDGQGYPRLAQHDSSGKTVSSSLHTAETHAPYKIEQRGDKWVVVNDIDEVKGTHDSKEEAREQQKALYANVPGASEQAEKKSSAKTAAEVSLHWKQVIDAGISREDLIANVPAHEMNSALAYWDKKKTSAKTAKIDWKADSHFGADYLVGLAPSGDIYEVYYNPNNNPTPCAWVRYGPEGDTGPNSGLDRQGGFANMQEAMKAAEAHAGQVTASKTATPALLAPLLRTMIPSIPGLLGGDDDEEKTASKTSADSLERWKAWREKRRKEKDERDVEDYQGWEKDYLSRQPTLSSIAEISDSEILEAEDALESLAAFFGDPVQRTQESVERVDQGKGRWWSPRDRSNQRVKDRADAFNNDADAQDLYGYNDPDGLGRDRNRDQVRPARTSMLQSMATLQQNAVILKCTSAWHHEDERHAFEHGRNVGERMMRGATIDPEEIGSINFSTSWQQGFHESSQVDLLATNAEPLGPEYPPGHSMAASVRHTAAPMPTGPSGGDNLFGDKDAPDPFSLEQARPPRTTRPRVKPHQRPNTEYVMPDTPQMPDIPDFSQPTFEQQVAAKISRLAHQVVEDNPHLSMEAARQVAVRALSKHPGVVGSN